MTFGAPPRTVLAVVMLVPLAPHSTTHGAVTVANVTLWLGAGTTSGFADGVGTSAKFDQPISCVVSPNGNDMFVVDYNNCRIRKVDTATGDVMTFAGNGWYYSGDGTGTAASFFAPYRFSFRVCFVFRVTSLAVEFHCLLSFVFRFGVCLSGDSMYVSESKYLRFIDVTTAAVTKFVGTGTEASVDGTGTAASVWNPKGMTFAFAVNKFLLAHQGGGSVLRMVTTSGAVVTTIAGSGTNGYANGVGTAAQFYNRIFQRIWEHSLS